METSPKSEHQNYQPLTFLSEASPASPSQSPANGLDLRIREALYFLNLPESCGIAEQIISALKMSKDYYLTTTEELLMSSSKRLMTWGMTCNGKLLTARITSPKTESEYSLSEILEDKPDPKYFLSEKTKERILSYLPSQQDIDNQKQTVAISVTDRKKKVRVGVLRRYKVDGGFREMKDEISPALTARVRSDGDNSPILIIPEATKKGYAEIEIGDAINLSNPNSKTRRGRVSKISPTIEVSPQIYTLTTDFAIRRLTPIECERLQGFNDGHTALGAKGETISDTQRYKTLGNAVTVPVIEDIFTRFFESVKENNEHP